MGLDGLGWAWMGLDGYEGELLGRYLDLEDLLDTCLYTNQTRLKQSKHLQHCLLLVKLVYLLADDTLTTSSRTCWAD
jgi:hypothetical protein